MISTLEIRYIPSWLNGVTGYYDVDPKDFESVLSVHDARLYRLANHLFMSKLASLGIAADYRFPDAEDFVKEGQGYSEDDAVFALYGNNPERLQVNQFDPTRFKIFSGRGSDVLFIDDPRKDPQNLYEALLTAISFYVGKSAAFESITFRSYLNSVNNYVANAQ